MGHRSSQSENGRGLAASLAASYRKHSRNRYMQKLLVLQPAFFHDPHVCTGFPLECRPKPVCMFDSFLFILRIEHRIENRASDWASDFGLSGPIHGLSELGLIGFLHSYSILRSHFCFSHLCTAIPF